MYLRKRETVGKEYKNIKNLFLSAQNLLVKKINKINKNNSYMLQEYCIVYSNELKTEYNKYDSIAGEKSG